MATKLHSVPFSSIEQWKQVNAAIVSSEDAKYPKIMLPSGWTRKGNCFYDSEGNERVYMTDENISYEWKCTFCTVEELKEKVDKEVEYLKGCLVMYAEVISKTQDIFGVITPLVSDRILRGNISDCQKRLMMYFEANKSLETHFQCICTVGPLAGKLVNNLLVVWIEKERTPHAHPIISYCCSVKESYTPEVETYLTKGLSNVRIDKNLRISIRDDMTKITTSLATLLHENVTSLRYVYRTCGLFEKLNPTNLCVGYFNLRQMQTLIDPSVKLAMAPLSNIGSEAAELFKTDGIEIYDKI